MSAKRMTVPADLARVVRDEAADATVPPSWLLRVAVMAWQAMPVDDKVDAIEREYERGRQEWAERGCPPAKVKP